MTHPPSIPEPLTVKQLINSFDWNGTSLGAQDSWPANLKVILSLVLNTSLPMVIYWGKTNIALYNDAYAKVIGTKHPALLGRPLMDIWPERKAYFNQIVSSIYQKETIKYTTDYHIPGLDNQHSPKTQIEVTFTPIVGDDNYVQGMLCLVTHVKEPITPSSTQTIEQLISGLAHDFNTLLAGIIGNLELMQMRIEQNKLNMLPSYIEAAQRAATKATEITHQLLSFSRRQTLIPHVINPNHTIQALLDTFYNFIKEGRIEEFINIHIQLEADIWSIFCDPEHLKNAIFQIFKNACESIHASNGHVIITTQNISITSKHPLRQFIKPDDYIVIMIEDNGEGMSPEMINRATDPFFTTKPLGKRAGLGLSMAYGFTKQSSGHLDITSHPSAGTTISLYLPRYHRPLMIQTLDKYHEKAKTHKALLISQDNRLCMLLSENLEDLSHSMTIAQTEKEALALLKNEGLFSFVAIDIRLLPEAKEEFIASIKQICPQMSILFITGYEETSSKLQKFINAQSFVIRKPITHTMLADYIKVMEEAKNQTKP